MSIEIRECEPWVMVGRWMWVNEEGSVWVIANKRFKNCFARYFICSPGPSGAEELWPAVICQLHEEAVHLIMFCARQEGRERVWSLPAPRLCKSTHNSLGKSKLASHDIPPRVLLFTSYVCFDSYFVFPVSSSIDSSCNSIRGPSPSPQEARTAMH